MRDKHIHVWQESLLLQYIYKEAGNKLDLSLKAATKRMLLKLVFYLILSLLFYSALYWVKAPLLFLLVYVAYGLSALLLAFNFAHDASHNALFSQKRWNNLAFVSIYTMVGAHAEAWRHRHIHSHHYAPNVEAYDTDLQISSLIRVTPDSGLHWYHRFQHWYAPFAYTTYSLYWILIKDSLMLLRFGKGIRYYTSFLVQKSAYLFYLLIAPLIWSSQNWLLVLVGFLLMHMVQSLFLLFTFFMTHHVEATFYPQTDKNGLINCSWVMNQIRSSNDFHPFSQSVNFIFGGFNNHIAHHLFPHVNHVHYPALSMWLYSVLKSHGITPNQTSFWGGVRSHLRFLKKMSR